MPDNTFAQNPYAPGGQYYGVMPDGNGNYYKYENGNWVQVGKPTPPSQYVAPGNNSWINNNPYAQGGVLYNSQRPPVSAAPPVIYRPPQQQQPQGPQQSPSNNVTDAQYSDLMKQLLSNLTSVIGNNGGQQSGGTGGMGQVSSGIEVGPVWAPGKVASASAGIKAGGSRAMPANMAGAGAGAQGLLGKIFGDNMRIGSQEAASDFDRSASYANAQQNLASQKAHAQSTLSGAELLARLQAMQMNNDSFRQNQAWQLLGGIGGLTGLM